MSEANYDDLAPAEYPFTLRGKRYVLREASEGANITVRNVQLREAKMVDGKVQADISRSVESQALLVSLCTFDEKEKLVPLHDVRSWPARVVKDLFTRAQQMSDLGEKKKDGEDPAKNSPESTTDTSG